MQKPAEFGRRSHGVPAFCAFQEEVKGETERERKSERVGEKKREREGERVEEGEWEREGVGRRERESERGPRKTPKMGGFSVCLFRGLMRPHGCC